MSWLTTSLVVLGLLVAANAQSALTAGTVLTGLQTGIQSKTQVQLQYFHSSPNVVSLLTFTLFPCFGQQDYFIGYEFMPDPSKTNNSCSLSFDGYERKRYSCSLPNPANNTQFNVLVIGKGQYSGSSDYSAKFDFLVDQSSTQYDSVVPTPGNNGQLQASLLSGLKKGQKQQLTLIWTGTGNAADKYTVYTYDSLIGSQSGYTYATGCGVKFFMKARTDLTIEKNGENYKAILGDLDPNAAFAVTVVVDRDNGYNAAYSAVLVNGGASLTSSFIFTAILVAFVSKLM